KLVIIAAPLIRSKKTNNSFSIYKVFKFLNRINLISDVFLDEMKNKYGSEDYKKANKVLKDTLVMAVNDDLSTILPNINTKVNLIYGEDDLVVPIRVGIDSSSIIPDSELTIIPDEGHNMLRSSSEKIIEIIKK
ncbi:MAG: alpha/beta fold hydrolase, partial [Candidatus Actinomarina sp.]